MAEDKKYIKKTISEFLQKAKDYSTVTSVREYINSIGLVKNVLKYTRGTAFSKYGYEKGNLLNYNLFRNFEKGNVLIENTEDIPVEAFYSFQDGDSDDGLLQRSFVSGLSIGSIVNIGDNEKNGNYFKKKITTETLNAFEEKIRNSKLNSGLPVNDNYLKKFGGNSFHEQISIKDACATRKVYYNNENLKDYYGFKRTALSGYSGGYNYLGLISKDKGERNEDYTPYCYVKVPEEIYFYDISKAPNPEVISINEMFNNGFTTTNAKDSVTTINQSYYQENESNGSDIVDEKITRVTVCGGRKDIISRTNELFRQAKIQSLINRFHTKAGDVFENDELVSSYSQYGLSRGRNLLKKGGHSNVNGYEDPYCRVWTSHHQYDKLSRRIRPFYNGSNAQTIAETQNDYGELRPNGPVFLNNNTVLKKDGFARMNPSRTNRSIKNCMFSIENLAWRDVDISRILSPEQRGSHGGRIMWFPPYNLKFTENVSVDWNSNKFIGRGEQIYTYTNTDRSGTLSFTLLIDHPSIINQYSKVKENSGAFEADILRYFAGCGNLEGKPEPEKTVNVEKTVKPNTPRLSRNEKYVGFVVFFPNNWTGMDYLTDIDGGVLKLYGYETSGISTCFMEIDKYLQKNVYENEEKNISGYLLNDFEKNTNVSFKDIRELNIYDVIKKQVFGEYDDIEIFCLLGTYCGIDGGSFENCVKSVFYNTSYEIKSVSVKGFASSHGGNSKKNEELARRRMKFLEEVAKEKSDSLKGFNIEECAPTVIVVNGEGSSSDPESINNLDAKLARRAILVFTLKPKNEPPTNTSIDNGYSVSQDTSLNTHTEINPAGSDQVSYSRQEPVGESFRYDNEYKYFEELRGNEMVYKYITDKIKYFDPAYHSITPEGFNARLTFLHQCTRQGPTVELSSGRIDETSNSYLKYAGNLAFGRPPYCILRIGDFYHTKICITSLSIDYDTGGGIQWDLNQEGIGVQPMYANVNLNFNFIGGQDLNAPIERLQNAVTANYYANASVYDERADVSGKQYYDVSLDSTTKGTEEVDISHDRLAREQSCKSLGTC